jgi:hypothetical protein
LIARNPKKPQPPEGIGHRKSIQRSVQLPVQPPVQPPHRPKKVPSPNFVRLGVSSFFGCCALLQHMPGLVLGVLQILPLETTKPHPQHGKPPIEVFVPDTSRDGRAGGAPLTPRRAPGAPKCASGPCNDTQEIAKSSWSYFYGVQASFVSSLSTTTACLVQRKSGSWVAGAFELSTNRLGARCRRIRTKISKVAI